MTSLFEEGYEAVFIGTGAGLPMFMHIEGENLNGVFSANEYLTRVNLMKAYRDDYDTPVYRAKTVAVVGGGNVAMDSARCAKRLGADTVYIVYRRSEQEMPARGRRGPPREGRGGSFSNSCATPVRILGDDKGWVKGIECVEMELGRAGRIGQARPIPKEGSEFTLDVDCVVMAIGTSSNPTVTRATGGLETTRRGCIVADEEIGQKRRSRACTREATP